MPKLPTTIRIGWLDYSVEEWPALEALSDGKEGDCDKSNSVIRVCTAYGPVRSAEVLLHETIHACWDMGSLGSRESEERVATVLAKQLAQVWRDNPKLVAFVSAALHGR